MKFKTRLNISPKTKWSNFLETVTILTCRLLGGASFPVRLGQRLKDFAAVFGPYGFATVLI